VNCPACASDSTRVVDSRLNDPGDAIRRRRECERCGARFTTYERAEAPRVVVVKRDGRREAFDRQKLLRGLVRAANTRPVSESQLDELADRIAASVRRAGPQVDAEWVGELALRGLAELDPVSGILFASVYRKFSDLSELEAEVRRLKEEPASLEGQLALGTAGTDLSDPQSTISTPLRRPRRRQKTPESTRRDHAAHP
jgi:transcriptional repressor NrdR